MSAPSAKRGDSVKFARSYATPTKKLNLNYTENIVFDIFFTDACLRIDGSDSSHDIAMYIRSRARAAGRP